MSEFEAPARSIPANVEAERAVLGSLMIDPDAIIKVANFLRPEDFFRERHAWLYEAMYALNERREPLDFVTLVDELERRSRLADVGGPAYLTDLIASTPTALYIDHYARIVERTAVLRRLIASAGKIAEIAYDESLEVDEVVDRAEQIIFGVSESRIHRDLTPIRAIMTRVVDHIDFLSRNQDRLMGVPTGFTMLDRLLGGLQKSDLIILAARPAMGKCVAAGTRLLNPQTGELTPIEALVEARHAPLLTLNADYKLAATYASHFVDDGVKPVYLVRTALGREIKVTLTHPFLTMQGWRPLGELQLGDYVAVPRTLPIFGTHDAPEQEAKLLGYFLADGCVCHISPQFTNSNPRLRADFAAAVANFPGVKVRYEDSQGQRTPTLYVTSNRETVIRERADFAHTLVQQFNQQELSAPSVAKELGVNPALIRFWLKGESVPSTALLPQVAQLLQVTPDQLAPNGLTTLRWESQNSVTRWLQQQGIWGKNAGEKFVPAAVFTYTRSKLALFLNRLFACDGSLYVQNERQAAITYGTVSKQLAHDVQHLLLRFGIIAKLRHRRVKYQASYRPAYEVRITDATSLQQFCTEIGAFGKEEVLARVLAQAQATNGHVNRDLIPVAVWAQILAKKGSQSWRALYQKMGLPPESNLHVGQRSPSRRRLRQIGEALADAELLALADSDLYWDEITAIDYLGEQHVYDLTVPTTHNFIADDMLVHNTSFCLSIAQNAAKRHGTRVAFFSLEMSNEQLVQRLLAMETAIDSHRLRLGTVHEEEWPILLEAANMLANTSVFIDDTPAVSVTDIRTKARRLYAEHGLDLIIIDYMQLMTGQSGGNGRNENRQQEISFISRSLKSLARELNVPVMALSQLSRAVESRADKRPMLSDLRESGCLTGDTLVTMSNGQRLPIAGLVGQQGFEVLSLNQQSWKLEPAQVSAAFCTGVKPVYRLTTLLGRTVRATANHKFLTFDGWKPLEELQAHDRVALPRNLPVNATATMSAAEVGLLGHLIGDGCTLAHSFAGLGSLGGDCQIPDPCRGFDNPLRATINHQNFANVVLVRDVIQYTTREIDLAETGVFAGMTLFKQNVSRTRAQRVADTVKCDDLHRLADSDVYWDQVVSIEADGTEAVYDLTVPGNHNFVADNIVVHNSIEQDADVVMFIYREDYYVEDTDRQNIADILVAKHRHGATGTVSLFFRKELTQFRDLEIQRTDLEY